MNRIIFAIIIIVFTSQVVFCQPQKGLFYWGQLDLTGTTYNYKFQQSRSILKRNCVGGNFEVGLSSGLHYRFHKNWAVEAGIHITEIDLAVNDNAFISKYYLKPTSSVSDGDFDIINFYYGPRAGVYYFFNTSSKVQPYINAGLSLNFISSKNPISHSFFYAPTGENLQLTAHYVPYYTSLNLETGLYIHNYKKQRKIRYFIGLRYYFAGNVVSGDYKDVQHGNVLYTDHATASGQYLGFIIRIGGLLVKSKNKTPAKTNTAYSEGNNNEYDNSIVKDTVKKAFHVSDSIPETLDKRTLNVKKVITVRSSTIQIRVWDNETVDGDVLSLNLNGSWILQNYKLQKEQKGLTEELYDRVNYLVLHAISEGSASPCTAAILINDGDSMQTVILNSDTNSSEAIQINVEL